MQLYEAARWSLEYINLRNLAGNGLKLGKGRQTYSLINFLLLVCFILPLG